MADNEKKMVPYAEKSKKAVKGKTKIKKKESFKDLIIEDDFQNVKSYVFREIFIPKLKETLFNIITAGAGMTFLGNSDVKGQPKSNRRYTSYSKYYKSYDDDDDDDEYDVLKPRNKKPGFYDVLFETYEDAASTYEDMLDCVKAEGYVTIAQYYDMSDQAPMVKSTDHNWGWKRLDSTYSVSARGNRKYRCIRHTPDDYYVIELPKAVPV